MNTVKKGSRGDDVKLLQRLLNVKDDGIFGSQTETLVKSWQKDNGLVPDGVVGLRSWQRIIDIYAVSPLVVYNPLVVHISQLRGRQIKYIVLHYTAGSKSSPGCANAVRSVFVGRNVSADFAVDDRDIVQFNPDIRNNYTWAVGDPLNRASGGGSYNGICTNRNSISIEMCSTLFSGWSPRYANHEGWCLTERTVKNAQVLVKILMQLYGITAGHVIRHYDVTGKLCPGVVGWNRAMVYDNLGKPTSRHNSESEWLNFKKSLQ